MSASLPTSQQPPQGGNMRVVFLCLGLTFGMLGMSFAAVPLYQLFCQVTGYGGTTQRAEAPTGTVLDKKITVRFDANVSNDLPWSFGVKKREITLKIGEQKQVIYVARNLGAEANFGTATFNVTPGVAGQYFNKIQCFCFTEQKLNPGQSIDMPVVFFVDPDIVNDPLLKDTPEITLSYTFFPDEEAEQRVSSAQSVTPKGAPRL
ncbi:MAG: cytochrome c oxidase assembly protein [Pseudomonadota bacterium]